MSVTFNTCPAENADAPFLFNLAKNLIDTYEDISAIDYEKVLAWVERKIQSNISSYHCILMDGIKVGYYRLIPEKDQTELDDLYILPDFQGKGIGTAVLKHCIKTVKTPLYLYVFKRNQGAVKLYSRMGFSVSEEVGNTRYIMRREVDRPQP